VTCPSCAARIQAGQQAPPATALGRAALYGAGAALAGAALYAAVAIFLNLQIGIIAIVVGIMVGKAVRAGAQGLGGRPQQILAVLLTYFAITTSYIPVFLYHVAKNPAILHRTATGVSPASASPQSTRAPRTWMVRAITLLLLFAAAPFFGLTAGIGGLITLFIVFIGLQRAWRLTGRSEILVMGPYEAAPAP
jgi:hypothetical protein